jgi:hypothetical protein
MAPKHERTPKKKDALDDLADPASERRTRPEDLRRVVLKRRGHHEKRSTR